MMDEGVVKYSLNFELNENIVLQESNAIEPIREDLYALGLIGAYEDGIGYGNISLKCDESNAFVITATQTGHLKNLTQKQYSLVQFVDFESFTTTATGSSKPSSEAITHACIYELDEAIHAVIHVHNEKLWRFMLENEYLSTNDTPYGTLEMVEDVKAIYKNKKALDNNAFVMKGHFEGVVTFGHSLKEAQLSLYTILKAMLS